GRLAGAQVEAGPVQPALDLALADVTLGQLDLRVRALVPHREVLSRALHDRDLHTADLDRDHSLVGYVGGGAGALERVAHWPALSPVSLSRFGTESARAPSVSTRFRFSSKVSVPSAAARISTSPIHTERASSPASAPL